MSVLHALLMFLECAYYLEASENNISMNRLMNRLLILLASLAESDGMVSLNVILRRLVGNNTIAIASIILLATEC